MVRLVDLHRKIVAERVDVHRNASPELSSELYATVEVRLPRWYVAAMAWVNRQTDLASRITHRAPR